MDKYRSKEGRAKKKPKAGQMYFNNENLIDCSSTAIIAIIHSVELTQSCTYLVGYENRGNKYMMNTGVFIHDEYRGLYT